MAEQVQTGGLMKFDYRLQKRGGLDSERRDAIEFGYAEAEWRKRKEKRNKIFFWVILAIIILILVILWYFLART